MSQLKPDPPPITRQERSRVVQLGCEGHLSVPECTVVAVVTTCSFGGTYRLDLQGRILSEPNSQQKQSPEVHAPLLSASGV